MPSWNSRGLRGSSLEELINLTNEKYREKKLALVQKIPTPITPINIDKDTRHITLAYFEKKSTVDYIGVVQGIPVCFDAKECKSDRFPLHNIHEHQIEFMRQYEEQDGVAFIIIYFGQNRHILLSHIQKDDGICKKGRKPADRKSFTFDDSSHAFRYRRIMVCLCIIWNRLIWIWKRGNKNK